jgi:hypothetical protein
MRVSGTEDVLVCWFVVVRSVSIRLCVLVRMFAFSFGLLFRFLVTSFPFRGGFERVLARFFFVGWLVCSLFSVFFLWLTL